MGFGAPVLSLHVVVLEDPDPAPASVRPVSPVAVDVVVGLLHGYCSSLAPSWTSEATSSTASLVAPWALKWATTQPWNRRKAQTSGSRSCPAGSRAPGGDPPLFPSRSFHASALWARPREGALASPGIGVPKVPWVALAPTQVAPRHGHPVPWHERPLQDLVARIAQAQPRTVPGTAGLDPLVSPAAEGAPHP